MNKPVEINFSNDPFKSGYELYPEDIKLLSILGIDTSHIAPEAFYNSRHNEGGLYLGRANYTGGYIDLSVVLMPSHFWTAKIYCAETKKIYKVSTGSGTLKQYWNTFEEIMNGMIVIEVGD